jgi:apolipoprotein N-acyltransferase
VQANVPVIEKRDPKHEARILDLQARLTETALAIKPDLLIWPEAATPRPLFSDQRSWDVVRGLVEKHTGDFLLGTVHFDELGDYNSAVLLTENASNTQIYNKIHLVPFGEYVPLRDSFPRNRPRSFVESSNRRLPARDSLLAPLKIERSLIHQEICRSPISGIEL